MKNIYWPKESWQTLGPEGPDIDTQAPAGLNQIIDNRYRNLCGLVIVRHGYLAYEHYSNGYGPDDTVHVASVTKSILSALIGIALDKGFINSVNQGVLEFFPEYVPGPDEFGKHEIRIKHLLTMTAPYVCDNEPFQEMCMSPDWTRFALDLLGGPMGPGTFRYSTAGAHLLSAIITRSTGMSAREFANQYLFGPIGMKTLPDYKITAANPMDFFQGRHVKGWVSDPAGNSAGGWGLTLTPRDMARFGYLYLNHGRWDQARIIPETWVGESTAMTPNNYGYLWWLFGGNKTNGSSIGTNSCSNGTNGRSNGNNSCNNGINGYAAMGDGGNIIFCSPESDVVIAATASLSPDSSSLMALIMEEIIPMALTSNHPNGIGQPAQDR